MPKVRYKSKATAQVEWMRKLGNHIGITTEGYLMLSRDGGKTYDTVFDKGDNEVSFLAEQNYEEEEFDSELDRPDDR